MDRVTARPGWVAHLRIAWPGNPILRRSRSMRWVKPDRRELHRTMLWGCNHPIVTVSPGEISMTGDKVSMLALLGHGSEPGVQVPVAGSPFNVPFTSLRVRASALCSKRDGAANASSSARPPAPHNWNAAGRPPARRPRPRNPLCGAPHERHVGCTWMRTDFASDGGRFDADSPVPGTLTPPWTCRMPSVAHPTRNVILGRNLPQTGNLLGGSCVI